MASKAENDAAHEKRIASDKVKIRKDREGLLGIARATVNSNKAAAKKTADAAKADAAKRRKKGN